MATETPKAPRKSAAQVRAEKTAERVDAWHCANSLIRGADNWSDGVTPDDVYRLAYWLAGE